MRSVSKLLFRVALATGVLLASAVVAVWLFAPAIVERAILQELHARGFMDARFDVQHVGLGRAAIGGVQIDAAGRLTVESLVVTYSLLGLLRGEMRTVEVVGARWVVEVEDRTLDLGPVDELFARRGPEGPQGEPSAELPIHRIELLGSEVVVATPTQRWEIPIEGELERMPDGFVVHVSGGGKHGTLELHGQLTGDQRIHAQLHAHGWSMGSTVGGRSVAVEGVSVEARTTIATQPLALEMLQLELDTGEIRVDDQHLDTLRVSASRVGEAIDLEVDWAAPRLGGVLGVRGRAVYDHDRWLLQIDDGRLKVRSTNPRELRADITLAGIVRVGGEQNDARALEATLDFAGRAGSLRAAGVRGTLRSARVQVQAESVVGKWDVRGRADVRLASVVHAGSGLRVEHVSASLPLHYPFSREPSGEAGRISVGPVRLQGSTYPALSGQLAQRGDELSVSLRWPLTEQVAARGRGRIGLTAPLEGHLAITAPPFALEDVAPVVALVERALGGSVSGTADLDGKLGIRNGAVTQTLRVRLHDVALSGSTKVSSELDGLAGTLELDSIMPPTSRAGQRLRWEGGRVGKLALGKGHVVFALEKGPRLVVDELTIALAAASGGGRIFVDAFDYAPDDPELRLRVTAASLSLRHWIELLGRDDVTGCGKLSGNVSARLRLSPSLRLRLDDGSLRAEPGGTLVLKDVRAAESVLASTGILLDSKSMTDMLKQRLIEALQGLRYTSLRFQLIRKPDGVTLQVHVAGRGTRGARQEIGGLTININHFEDAVNQLLRLRGGAQKRETSHAPQP